MPKVEAAAHRNRHRPTPIPKPRFETLRGDDQHNYEFDRHYQSLRVAWSGGQTFISSKETKQLHAFLNRIYQPSERPTLSYRTQRRGRQQGEPQRSQGIPEVSPIEKPFPIPASLSRQYLKNIGFTDEQVVGITDAEMRWIAQIMAHNLNEVEMYQDNVAHLAQMVLREKPDTTSSETPKKPSVEFQEYNGWPNYPSWSVFTVMSSFKDTYDDLQRIANQQPGGRGGVRRAVLGSVEHWKNETPTPYAEAARLLVQDFVMNGIRKVEWTSVYDTLRGERQELGEANPLTTLAYDLLSHTDWKSVVAGAESLIHADDTLRGWIEDQCLTWIERPDARKHSGSVGKFAEAVLETYFEVVQWENVTDALRTE